MSYDIGIIKPAHPDAIQDKESEMRITSFLGPDMHGNSRWLQISIGTEIIRLNPAQILSLHVLTGMRLEGTDTEMLQIM